MTKVISFSEINGPTVLYSTVSALIKYNPGLVWYHGSVEGLVTEEWIIAELQSSGSASVYLKPTPYNVCGLELSDSPRRYIVSFRDVFD